MSAKQYDVVIVGAGICGSIVAREMAARGMSVLVLEAGMGTGLTPQGYRSYLETFYTSLARVPNSPYPDNANAPSPTVLSLRDGYFHQVGPDTFASDYLRAVGGTTLHWLGTCLRMLPNDFRLAELGLGDDVRWPITYDDLRPYYERAEWEIGVAGDVAAAVEALPASVPAKERAAYFGSDYRFPMQPLPPSVLDRRLEAATRGLRVELGKGGNRGRYAVRVGGTPQGRNSMPTPGTGYRPVGAVGDPGSGQRCEGNASCVPICPVQAKYNALKTLYAALATERVDLLTQAVASDLEYDANGRVRGVTYKRYLDPRSPEFELGRAHGTVYVIAAHAVETAKLLLASGSRNPHIGRYLMDHPFMLTWGMMRDPVWSYRGPGATSGIESFRDGAFRREHAPFRVEIGNWGWALAVGAPDTVVATLVDGPGKDGSGARLTRDAGGPLHGPGLRAYVARTFPRHFRLGWEPEQLPRRRNRVTIDDRYRDALGNFRPVIDYEIDGYTLAAMLEAKRISTVIFRRIGAADWTDYRHEAAANHFDQGVASFGSGHYMGTHRMGRDAKDGVVDRNLRCFDHDNLYLVGCGSMRTIGTSNPTLTAAALAFKASDSIAADLIAARGVAVGSGG